MKILLPTLFALLFSVSLFAQSTTDENDEDFNPHAVNPLISLPLAVGAGYLGQDRAYGVREKELTPIADIMAVNRNDVPGIDRWALDLDTDGLREVQRNSDYVQNISHAAPFALFIWKKYRRNWLDITTMYLEAQALQGLIYGYAPFGPTQTNRFRPSVYYTELDMESRRDGNARNSMFSGHVSTSTTSVYFLAKMIDDYNPDFTTGQRILLYAGATVPAAYGGWLRIKALKHFPTDVAVGTAVGAFSGIMVPQFHKWWAKKHAKTSAMISPFYGGGAGGGSFVLTF